MVLPMNSIKYLRNNAILCIHFLSENRDRGTIEGVYTEIEIINKNQTEILDIKNKITELRNSLQGLKSRFS